MPQQFSNGGHLWKSLKKDIWETDGTTRRARWIWITCGVVSNLRRSSSCRSRRKRDHVRRKVRPLEAHRRCSRCNLHLTEANEWWKNVENATKIVWLWMVMACVNDCKCIHLCPMCSASHDIPCPMPHGLPTSRCKGMSPKGRKCRSGGRWCRTQRCCKFSDSVCTSKVIVKKIIPFSSRRIRKTHYKTSRSSREGALKHIETLSFPNIALHIAGTLRIVASGTERHIHEVSVWKGALLNTFESFLDNHR